MLGKEETGPLLGEESRFEWQGRDLFTCLERRAYWRSDLQWAESLLQLLWRVLLGRSTAVHNTMRRTTARLLLAMFRPFYKQSLQKQIQKRRKVRWMRENQCLCKRRELHKLSGERKASPLAPFRRAGHGIDLLLEILDMKTNSDSREHAI